jgi:hypothetical protein
MQNHNGGCRCCFGSTSFLQQWYTLRLADAEEKRDVNLPLDASESRSVTIGMKTSVMTAMLFAKPGLYGKVCCIGIRPHVIFLAFFVPSVVVAVGILRA